MLGHAKPSQEFVIADPLLGTYNKLQHNLNPRIQDLFENELMNQSNPICCPAAKRLFLGIAVIGAMVVATFSQLGSVMATTEPSKTLRHVVQFQFKADSSADDVQKVVDAFRALPGKITEVAGFEYGTNNSPEGLADGFTHCFLVTFKSEDDRATYIKHPDHQAFVAVLKPHLEKVQVIDFWSAK